MLKKFRLNSTSKDSNSDSQSRSKSFSISNLNIPEVQKEVQKEEHKEEQKEEKLPIPNECTLNDLTYDIEKKDLLLLEKKISKISTSHLQKMDKQKLANYAI